MLSVLHRGQGKPFHLASVHCQWPCGILQRKSHFFFSWSSEDKEINLGAGKSQTWQVQNNLIIKKQHKRPANSFDKKKLLTCVHTDTKIHTYLSKRGSEKNE